jgi:hypothetical protein
VELGNADQLAAKFPEAAADIREFPVPARSRRDYRKRAVAVVLIRTAGDMQH